MQTICLLYPLHLNNHTAINSPPSLYSDKLNKRGAPYSSVRNFFFFSSFGFFFFKCCRHFQVRGALLSGRAKQSCYQLGDECITRSARRHGIKRRLLTSDIIQVRRKERERESSSFQSIGRRLSLYILYVVRSIQFFLYNSSRVRGPNQVIE